MPVNFNGSYSQNFDTLANTGTPTWADDTTILGWYATRQTGGTFTAYTPGTGSSTTGALYSFGATGATERALGSVASGTPGDIYYGLRLVNSTGAAINSFTVSYTGEEWRNGGNTTQQKLNFSYQTGASVTSLTTGTWTPFTGLDFTGPIATATASALDGNLAANRVVLPATTISLATPLAVNQEILFRWEDINDPGSDHGLAIDDFSVSSAVPQPDLTITNSAPASAVAGTPYAYTLTVNNSGTGNATGVGATFTLPTGVTYNSATGTNGFTAAQAGSVVTFSSGSINAAGSATLTVNVTPTAPGTTITSAVGSAAADPTNAIAESNEANNTSTTATTTTVTATSAPDLSIAVAAPTTAFAGTPFNYTLTLNNSGTAPATGVGAQFTLPTGLTYNSASGTGFTATQAGGVVTFSGGSINAAGSATLTVNVTPTAAGTVTIPASAAVADPSNTVAESNETNNSSTTTASTTVTAASTFTPVYTIQGSGTASPLVNTTVTTEGIVVGDYQGTTGLNGALNGFFIQDPTGDGNPLTSDGIFVFIPTANALSNVDVNPGDRVRITGTVKEFSTLTEIDTVTALTVLSTGNAAITPTTVVLPETVNGDLERYEGMLVNIPQAMTVSQNYFQGRYGEVTLSSGGRLFNPTNVFDPGSAAATALADENARRLLVLDDGKSNQNPNPIPYIGTDNTLRAGDTVTGLTGVLDYGLISSDTTTRDYRLQPTVTPTFTRVNNRTAAPEPVGGTLKVVGMNVLNYFTTLTSQSSNARGADTAAEFTRQRDKIIRSITTMDADVLGLSELENNTTAIDNLVAGLNAVAGAGTYAKIADPTTGVGTDAIKVGLIYKPGKVTPVGVPLSDNKPIYNRVPVAQTFKQNSNNEIFTPIVNHFKSKSASAATGLDLDQNDGQGAYNDRRKQQATALLDFINTVKTTSGDSDVLVIGDLNSYAKEDPIRILTNGGLTNEIAKYVTNPYSFVFDGQSGYLDHALSTASLSSQITGVSEWHINADEPEVINYDLDFKTQDLYTPTPYRASDHDPVVIGLNLGSSPEIAVLDGTTDIPDGTTTPINIGTTAVGTPISKTFTVKNTGTSSLTLGTPTLPTGFTLLTPPPTSIAAGGSASFQVQLNPAIAGTFSGTLSFVNNDSNENPFDFPITGIVNAATTPPTTGNPSPDATLTQKPNNIFQIGGSAGTAQLKFAKVPGDAKAVNEIGVFLVNDDAGKIGDLSPGQPGYIAAAIAKSKVVFSTLPSGNFESGNNTSQLTFNTGSRLGFYLVANGTTDTARLTSNPGNILFGFPSGNGGNQEYLRVSQTGTDPFTLSWEDAVGGGDRDYNDIVLNVQVTKDAAPIGTRQQGDAEIIDLTDYAGRKLAADVVVTGSAAYNDFVGLYKIDDATGKVGNLKPGDAGYAKAALERAVVEYGNRNTRVLGQLDGGGLLAPFIVANASREQLLAQNPNNDSGSNPNAYFSFLGANPDGVDHIRLLGNNTFGFEDLKGGGDRDFNDAVFQVNNLRVA